LGAIAYKLTYSFIHSCCHRLSSRNIRCRKYTANVSFYEPTCCVHNEKDLKLLRCSGSCQLRNAVCSRLCSSPYYCRHFRTQNNNVQQGVDDRPVEPSVAAFWLLITSAVYFLTHLLLSRSTAATIVTGALAKYRVIALCARCSID